jgi:AmpD protein
MRDETDLKVDVVSGWLAGAERVPSPNFDERPGEAPPQLVVVHAISLPPGEFGGPWIDHLFTNALDPAAHPYFQEIAGLEVSAHVLIRRDGQIVQYVPFHCRAWHAGASCWQGRERCNDFSIGIELEGCDELPFEDVQYVRLAQVIQALHEAYPSIAPDAIAGHSDIAPCRKTDPGPYFDWPRLWAGLQTGDSGLS